MISADEGLALSFLFRGDPPIFVLLGPLMAGELLKVLSNVDDLDFGLLKSCSFFLTPPKK